MALERTDRLRRRPDKVRYFYLAVSSKNLHTGMSHWGLEYVRTKHGVDQLYVADIVTGRVIPVTEPVENFMARWREHYNDPKWDYAAEIEGEKHGDGKRK
mgnify:CR=1 FL=1